jgi:hypothetical protein
MTAVLARRSDRAFALAVAGALLGWLAIVSPVAALEPPARGTVKIHEAPDHKNGAVMANDPKVCQFVIHGFGFDANENGNWRVLEHQWGNGQDGAAVLSGSYQADANGDWSAPSGTNAHDMQHGAWYELPNGHYKLYVEARNLPTTEKHKVFKVECEETAGGGQTPPPSGGQTPPPSGGQTPPPSGGQTPPPSGGQTPPPSGGANLGGSGSLGGSGTLGGSGGPGASTAAGGTVRGAVAGGQGGPGAGSLPNTAVPAELAGSLGGLLVVLSGIAYAVNRRRDS